MALIDLRMIGLSPFACRPEDSQGRLFAEAESPMRSVYQRDRDRVIHSTAFRRLEYKTQVLVNFEGDHFRTRLTHSLEVAQIARTLSRVFAVNEDLAETVALAHDLGHSPFGHAGEHALDAALQKYGGFDHNLQTFRVITLLEQRYADFDGLNLTAETLEGIIKHNGPLRGEVASIIADHPWSAIWQLQRQAPIEAQFAAIADDVAYCNHDLDDGLRANFFDHEELCELPFVGEVADKVLRSHKGVRTQRLIHEIVRRLIDGMVSDIVEETHRRLAQQQPQSLGDIRECDEAVVAFSGPMAEAVKALRAFLHRRMYGHYKVNRMTLKAQRLVTELTLALLETPSCLPDRWREEAGDPGSPESARAVRDYVAGMTDRFAVDEHERLFNLPRYRA